MSQSIELPLEPDFMLADWIVRPSACVIARNGTTERLEPRVMQVLVRLARAEGRTVSRDMLLQDCWGGIAVTDDAVTRCITKLRRVFGTEPVSVALRTVPKVGYCLSPADPMPLPDTGGWQGTGSIGALLADTAAAEPALVDRPRPDSDGTVRPMDLATDRPRAGSGMVMGAALAAAAIALVLILGGLARSPSERPQPPRMASVVPLTYEPGAEFFPALAPGGGTLAYVNDSSGQGGVFLRATPGGTPIPLEEGPGWFLSPVWSPDGASVAYLVGDPGQPCGIKVAEVPGGRPRFVGRCAAPLPAELRPGLAWTADGQGLVFSDRERPSGPVRLWRMAVRGAEPEPLTAPPGDALGDMMPVTEPGGGRLAFVRSFGAQEQLLLREADGAERVLMNDAFIRGLAWSPDGDAVLATLVAGGRRSVAWVPLDGGAPQPLALQVRHPGMLAIDAASRRLAVESFDFRSEIRLFSPGDDDWLVSTSLAPSTSRDWDPMPSPGGDSVAFMSVRSGAADLWLAFADGRPPRRLTFLEAADARGPRWSSDGRRIAFAALKTGGFDLFLADTGSGEVVRLTTDAAEDGPPQWTPDGALLFGSRRDGDWRLYRMTPEPGAVPVPVTDHGVRVGKYSPDGHWLWMQKVGGTGLWRRPAPGMAGPDVHYPEAPTTHWRGWEPVGDRIVAVRHERPAPPKLLSYDPETGKTLELLDLPNLRSTSGIGPGVAGTFALAIDTEQEIDILGGQLEN